MTATVPRKNNDAHLWAYAVVISVVLNLAFLAWISIEAIKSEIARKLSPPAQPVPEQTVVIYPELLQPEPVPEEVAPQAVRTSPDQESAEPPASRRYIGERNTQATSDRPPTGDDPTMPSQSGIDRPNVETTESDYQDGKLEIPPSPATAPSQPSPPAPPSTFQPPSEQAKGIETPLPGEAEKPEPAIREKLLETPNFVETPVPKSEESLKPTEEKNAREGTDQGLAEKKQEKTKTLPKPKPKPAPVSDPAFSGNQNKTAIQGNISRTGKSALDVADTSMGRYQAKISRAVEQEWRRNCVRHRDFITPGFLTVRFFVQSSGKVKSVQFIGDNQTGEVQKGFTLNSIRDAEIPAMPSDVKKEMGGDSLELIFNFYF
ncbi:MAG: hypothetical protein ACSHX7_07965 [Luteolibacter sp.]